jgi:cell division protein FtsZ
MEQKYTIKVIGVDRFGVYAVNHMIDSGLKGIGFIVVDTDAKTFDTSKAPINIQIGEGLKNTSNNGADPWARYLIALNEISEIGSILEGSDIIFILAGMEGFTDTEVSSLIAKIGRMVGALTVAIVTWPGSSEEERIDQAEKAINKLLNVTDTVIPLPMDRIEKLLQKDAGKKEIFNKVYEVIYQSVKGITDLILSRNLVGLDIFDVKAILSRAGGAVVGFGQAKGKKRSVNAAKMAVSHPFMEHISITDAKSILLNLTAGDNISLEEMTEGAGYIYDEADDPEDMIWGVPIDNSLNDYMRVMLIATGIDVPCYVQGKRSKGIQR